MEVPVGFLVVSLLLSCFAATTHGVFFSSLKDTLIVTASPTAGQVLKAGEDKITVTWGFNSTFSAGTDSACPHKIVARPYAASNNSFSWTIERDIPSAIYFVRAFAFDAQDVQVAYGQTTDAHKTANLFEVQAITGRHVSLDIASVCFSAFSVVSLAVFFYIEKSKGKASQQK